MPGTASCIFLSFCFVSCRGWNPYLALRMLSKWYTTELHPQHHPCPSMLFKSSWQCWGYSSVVGHLLSIHEALSPIPHTAKKHKKTKQKNSHNGELCLIRDTSNSLSPSRSSSYKLLFYLTNPLLALIFQWFSFWMWSELSTSQNC